MKLEIPLYVKPFLWSYDTENLHRENDKKRIITNVLNLGNKASTDWLFKEFNSDEIREAITNPLSGEWNKKSLNFWSIVLDVSFGDTNRKLKNI